MTGAVLRYETRRGLTPVLALTGDPDADVIGDLARELRTTAHGGAGEVVVDLLGVDALRSSTVVALCGALRAAAHDGRRLMVVVDGYASWVLDSSGITGVEIHSTITAALARCGEESRSRPLAAVVLRRLNRRRNGDRRDRQLLDPPTIGDA